MNTNGKEKKWTVKPSSSEDFLSAFPHIPPLILQLLWNRGITEKAAVETFLNPDYERDVHDPFLFRHMNRAVERIKRALRQNEKITVFGDYDADGVCGAAILSEFFKKIGACFDTYIPDRSREHFGLSLQKVKDFRESGTKLLITVDCGVTDYDEIQLANSFGIDAIILDHHIVPPRWPEAYAIIDHKHPEETYPEHVLSGAGLAFKIVQALVKTEIPTLSHGWEKWLLDLVAIAAVADMVPLAGENRALVSYGLRVLKKTRREGLKALFTLREMNPRDADIETISHFIAPRINAASRMDHANTAFALLTTEHEEEARWLARRLEEKNEERKKIVEEIISDLHEKISGSTIIPSVIFEGSAEWPAGVLGLAAARLVETYNRPVFLYAANEELIKGSCRAPKGGNVVELMAGTGSMFTDFGGHSLSGGFSALPENISALKEKLTAASQNIGENLLPIMQEVDAELTLDDINDATYETIKTLEPFGQENPRPVFLIRNAKIADLRKVGADGNHLKMKLGSRYTGAIYFRAGDNGFRAGDTIDICAELRENVWNGSRKIELKIVDAKHSK